jgi:sugar phosphate isomerase/epimerase
MSSSQAKAPAGMELSLSVRIAEAPTKDRLTAPFEDLVEIARDVGYSHLCVRASAGGVQSPPERLRAMRRTLDDAGLRVSMATTDFDVPLNNERGPRNLRDFGPHLDVAAALGAPLVRVCMKRPEDLDFAREAAAMAAARGKRIAHQCHVDSLFETVDETLERVARVGHDAFGIIYEPGNLLLCGQPYGRETLERLAPCIFNVYLQNHRVADDGPCELLTRVRGRVRYHNLPLWERGGIDFAEVFDGLRRIGYAGTVTVHQEFAELAGPQEAAARSYAFLTGLLS